MFRSPTAVCSRTMNAPWPMCCAPVFPCARQEVHIERPNGVRGIALVDIEAVRDDAGNIVGAVNCFQDITERKRAEEQIANMLCARGRSPCDERVGDCAGDRASHASPTIFKVQSAQSRDESRRSRTPIGCFVESRWTGADLHGLVTAGTCALLAGRARARARISIGPEPRCSKPDIGADRLR